jgi:hypothetical protein
MEDMAGKNQLHVGLLLFLVLFMIPGSYAHSFLAQSALDGFGLL